MRCKVIVILFLSSCLIITTNWTDLSQSDYDCMIKILRRKRGRQAGGVASLYYKCGHANQSAGAVLEGFPCVNCIENSK